MKRLDQALVGDGLEADPQEPVEVSFTVRPQSWHQNRQAAIKIWVERQIEGRTEHYHRDGPLGSATNKPRTRPNCPPPR